MLWSTKVNRQSSPPQTTAKPAHRSAANLSAASVQLYDVVSDPRESVDHAASQPALVAQLRAALQAYNTTGLFGTSFVCGAAAGFENAEGRGAQGVSAF